MRVRIQQDDIARACRLACRGERTSQCASICLSESTFDQQDGKCPHASAVWSIKVTSAMEQAAALFDEEGLVDVAKAINGPWERRGRPEDRRFGHISLDAARDAGWRSIADSMKYDTLEQEAGAAIRAVLVILAAQAARRQQAGQIMPADLPIPTPRKAARAPRARLPRAQ